MKQVTAGRDALGEFAPKFAELNDDVLFGQIWSREDKLSPRDRSLVTVTARAKRPLFCFNTTYPSFISCKNCCLFVSGHSSGVGMDEIATVTQARIAPTISNNIIALRGQTAYKNAAAAGLIIALTACMVCV